MRLGKTGFTRNGIQRYRCYACGKTFTPVTGTIFEGHKIAIREWMDYTLNIIRYVRGDLEFNLYRLRHNMATSLVTQQIDSRTTMEILGHAHYDMSLYYAVSNRELKEKAIDQFS